MRWLGLLFFLVCSTCSSGEEPASTSTRPGKAPAKAGDGDGDGTASTPAKRPPEAADRWTGTFAGRAEAATGEPSTDGGTSGAWSGEGTVRLEVAGEEVTGSLEGGGTTLTVRGTLVSGKLRAWLGTDGEPGSLLMGHAVGVLEGDSLRGTWRASTSAGAEVRAGTFEVRKDDGPS